MRFIAALVLIGCASVPPPRPKLLVCGVDIQCFYGTTSVSPVSPEGGPLGEARGATGQPGRPFARCGKLEPEAIAKFHAGHLLSNGANVSSVEGLAAEGWIICVENGRATIEDHPTAQDLQ